MLVYIKWRPENFLVQSLCKYGFYIFLFFFANTTICIDGDTNKVNFSASISSQTTRPRWEESWTWCPLRCCRSGSALNRWPVSEAWGWISSSFFQLWLGMSELAHSNALVIVGLYIKMQIKCIFLMKNRFPEFIFKYALLLIISLVWLMRYLCDFSNRKSSHSQFLMLFVYSSCKMFHTMFWILIMFSSFDKP